MFEWWNQLKLRITGITRRKQLERDLQDEMDFHLQMSRERMRQGGNGDSERDATRRFGNPTRVREECREVWSFVAIERMLSDIRYAARALAARPGFSLVAILTLALGIGANSAVFSAIDTILLRPLAFPEGARLMMLEQYNPKVAGPGNPVAPLRLDDWQRMNSTFDVISGYYTEDVSESSAALPEKLTRAWVAPGFFRMWNVLPSVGRDFLPAEEKYRGPAAAVISSRLWRRRFNADPGVIGRQLKIERAAITIVGVMPDSFPFPVKDVDVWSPSPLDAPFAQSRESTWFYAVGRLKSGVSEEQAQADLTAVQNRLGQDYPKTDRDLAVRMRPLKEVTIGAAGRSLWILYGSVTLLLLIACTNIAGLMLARTADREHEISIRLSLGASRLSVLTRLLTEAFLLALAGSALGLALAAISADTFRRLAADLPRIDEIRLNWTLVIYTLGCAVGATLLCGLIPAARSIRRSIAGSLSHGGRSQVSSGSTAQWLLVGVQVALSVTLLVGAGLLLRSFQELGKVSSGFDSSKVLLFRISANWGETVDLKAMWHRVDETLDALRSVPGVEDAATTLDIPGVGTPRDAELRVVEGDADPARKISASSRIVSAGYFSTMRIPLLAGESCRPSEVSTALVNRRFAEMYFVGVNAVGHHLETVPPNPYTGPAEIRGLVENTREQGLNHEPAPMVYWCNSAAVPTPVFLVRTAPDPATFAAALRQKVHEIQPNRSVYSIVPLDDYLAQSFSETRLRTILLTFFAVTAVVLTCIGVYGTLSYLVNMRRREVGLRIALGALPGRIAGRFLGAGLRVCLLGGAFGLIIAAACGRWLNGLLYGVSALDPLTYATVFVLVAATGALASLLPALRASRVHPTEVLRQD